MGILDILNTKWIKESIWYNFSSNGKESRNVSTFLRTQLSVFDIQLKNILFELQLENLSNDKKIILILRWVHKNFTYVTDRVQYKETEHWANVGDSLDSMKGDCEDGAILIYCLARKAGIPTKQIKLVAGSVVGGGHCWIKYISTKFLYGCFYIDWCYWYDSSIIGRQRTFYFDYKDDMIIGDDYYMKYWFLADENNGYKKVKW